MTVMTDKGNRQVHLLDALTLDNDIGAMVGRRNWLETDGITRGK